MLDVAGEPSLRKDLIVSRQETPEGTRFVLKDPITGRYFRFQEAEYAVVRRLDGATPLAAVARDVSAELGVEADAESVAPFVEVLRRQGLLQGAGAPVGAAAGLFRGNPLWLRLKAFDPDRLFDRLLPWVRFCFTPQFVVASATLILWAIATTVVNRAEILADLGRLWRVESLLVAWLVMLAVTTCHEFAHGLTTKHFGGHVHEIGFLLIYFQPAFYCNISDAWLFPEKSRRLWVTFAGGYFELFLWGLSTLVWRLVESGTWISGLALIVMATSGIKQMFNLNPLIKLDGYYLLSDWLEIPNLRQRAFSYVGYLWNRLTFGTRPKPELIARERRIFLIYGLAAFTFSYWFLFQIARWAGTSLTYNYQAWGLAIFIGLLALVFQQPLKRLAGGVVAARSSEPTGSGSVPAPVSSGPSAPAAPAVPAPRRSRVSRRAKLGLVAAVAVIALAIVKLPLTVGGEFVLLPARNADVRAAVEGLIERVYVDEGARVAEGDTIARLSDRDYRARLRMAEAQIEEKRYRLRMLRAGARPEELTLARLAVAKAEERLGYARTDAERVRSLRAAEAASAEELARAEERLGVSAKELEEARTRLDVLLAGSRRDSVAAAEQDLARSEAERDRLAEQVHELVVTSPHAGIVTTPKLRDRVGEHVNPGDLITEVHALNTVRAEIAVSERDIGDVRVGERAALRFRAYPEQVFEGRVARIAAAAVDSAARGGRVVNVEVELDNPGGILKTNLTGYARIYAGERRALDLLTRRFRRFLRLEFWSWW